MSFYKEVPGRQTTLESTLKFDTEPKAGSTNPVTSDGVKSAIDGAVGDAAAALQDQIDDIAEKAGSGYIPKGEATVATLNALSGQENGELYTMTDAGTLTDGSLAVVAGDTVAWDATNEVWYKAMDYAPSQYGTNEVHNLPTTAVGGDLVAGNYLALDGNSGTKKLGADILLNTATNKSANFIYPSSGDENMYVLTDGGKSRVINLTESTTLKNGVIPIAKSSFSGKVNLLSVMNKCVQQSGIFDGYTSVGSIDKTAFTTSGYYAGTLTIGAKFTDTITSGGYKASAVDISGCNVVYIETSSTTSGRGIVIVDENNIVLEIVQEKDCYDGKLIVRGVSNWKYLYASVQSNGNDVYVEYGLARFSTTNYSKRKFGIENAEKSEANKFVNYKSGNFQSHSSYSPNAVEFMNVSAGSKVRIILRQVPLAGDRGVAFYDKDKVYISGVAYVVGTKEYLLNTPSNACYISVTTFGADNILLIEESEFKPTSANGIVDAELGYTPVLTPYIPCVIGKNLNVVLNNIFLEVRSQDDVYKLYWESGNAYDGDVELSPTQDETQNIVVAKKYNSFNFAYPLPIKTCPANSGSGLTKKVMFIGESTTDNNVVLHTLMEDLVGDALTIELVGTRQDSYGDHHEARGGWTTQNYMDTDSIDGVPNAFYNPITQYFDIDYYFTNSGVSIPDIVVINFGLNDITRGLSDATTIANLDTIINGFKSKNPNVVTIIATPNLPTALKMTWGYGSNRREAVLKKDLSLINEYKGRETTDHIYLCPIHLSLHPIWDMPYAMRDVNSRNSHQVVVAVSPAPTHPSAIGYQKMGDCYYNTIKYVVHEEFD